MLVEAKIKANLHLGHVIKITFNKETGEVGLTQSKKLIWEEDYPPFQEMRFHIMMEDPIDFSLIKELDETLNENGILYGCVLSYSEEKGYVNVTFHKSPTMLLNLAKITLETRPYALRNVEKIWKKDRYKESLYSYNSWSYQKCYCGKVLDPDINVKCPNCTGYICVCEKCHCTEGKNYNNI